MDSTFLLGSGCSSPNPANCYIAAGIKNNQTLVIPPVQSAMISTRDKVAIQYGRVVMRARMPTGDWLWPQISLVPQDDAYGAFPASGLISIFESRGNRAQHRLDQLNNEMVSGLHWGPADAPSFDRFYLTKPLQRAAYCEFDPRSEDAIGSCRTFIPIADDFGVDWTPTSVTMWVNSRVRIAFRYGFGTSKTFWKLGDFGHSYGNGTPIANPRANSGNQHIAPFNKPFCLRLAIRTGGTDGYWTDTLPNKPWRNTDKRPQAMSRFWAWADIWLPTSEDAHRTTEGGDDARADADGKRSANSASERARMLRYEDVQWWYTGEPHSARGKSASSGFGVVCTDATRLMVYESASAESPAYTLVCQGIEGVFPLHETVTLPRYHLLFTRAPTHEGTADATSPRRPLAASTPALQRHPSVAGPRLAAGASFAAGSLSAFPAAATGPHAVAAPRKRKATAVASGLLPASPPRGPVAGHVPRHQPTAAARVRPVAQPQATKRRRTAAPPSALPSLGPEPRRSSSVLPVTSTPLTAAPVPAKTALLAPPATNDPGECTRLLAPKEQQARERYRAVMQQWTAEWIAQAEARHVRERNSADAVTGDANRLFEVVNRRIRGRVRYGPALGPESPARRHLSSHGETVCVLANFALEAFLPPPLDSSALRRVRYDPFAPDTDAAILEPARGEGGALTTEDAGAQFYLRSLIFSDAKALRTFLAAYQEAFDDEGWTKATLRACELSRVASDAPVALHYAGMTIRSSPGGRVVADLSLSGGTRCANLLQLARQVQAGSLAPPQLLVHEWVELRLPASVATDANQPVIGDTEVALIAAIKPASFNSADGGRLLRVDPSALCDFTEVVARLGATRSALDVLAPPDPPCQRIAAQLKAALDDALSYYQCHAQSEAGGMLDPTTEGGRWAFDDILANMTALCTRVQGRGFNTFEFLLAKDITANALAGEETFSSGNNAARGPAAGYLLDRLVQDSAPSNQGWRSLTPSANLWALTLRHGLLLALIFAIRVLHLARPLLLVSHSGVINSLLRDGYFRDVLDPDREDLEAFLEVARQTDPALIESIQSPGFDVSADREDKAGGWILTVGSTAVVRYGPLGKHIGLHLSQLDPGFFKYNPAIQDEAVALFAAAAAKTALCRRVLAEHLVCNGGVVPEDCAGRLDFCRRVRQQAEDLASECGLDAELAAARRTLADRFSALNSARALATNRRQARADGEQEAFERRSANALAAVAGRVERPVFIGTPLNETEISELEPLFDADGMLRPERLQPARPGDRLAALQTLLLHHAEATADGVTSGAPVVAIGPVGSRPYCKWYLSAPKGAELARSAIQVGHSELRMWSDGRRAAYLEDRTAYEVAQRQARGVELQGELSLAEALRMLREDQLGAGIGRGSRRDIFLSVCCTCEQVFLEANFALSKGSHACGADSFVRIPVLFSSTLALLLDVSLLDLDHPDLPGYYTASARSLLPDKLKAVLPFDPALDPPVEIPVETRRELLLPLALDALLVASRSPAPESTAAQRVLSVGGHREAWLGNYRSSLACNLRALLAGTPLVADFCLACLKSRIVPANRPLEQHLCEPATIERSGVSVKNRVYYQEDYRSPLPSGASLLLLGPEPYRRLLYALADPHDELLKTSREEMEGVPEQDRMQVLAFRLLRWRQP